MNIGVRRFQCKFPALGLCPESLANRTLSISGVGVRGYYAKLGYWLDGPYMSKWLDDVDDVSDDED